MKIFMPFTNINFKAIKSSEIVINYILIIGYPLLFISFGMDFTDGPWNIRMTQSPEPLMPYWLSAKTTKLWVYVFGDSMISIRIVYYFTLEFIIFLIMFTFFSNKNKLQFSRYGIVSVVLIIATTSYTFNYGTTTVLFLTVLLICLIQFIKTNKLIYISVLGIVSILAMLARFPNIVIIPLLFFLLGLFPFIRYNETSKFLKNIFTLVLKIWLVYAVSILTTLLLIQFLFISPQNYFYAIFETLSSESQSDKYHSLKRLLISYNRDLFEIAKYLSVLVLMAITYQFSVDYLKLKKWVRIAAIFSFYLFFLYTNNPGKYNYGFNLNIAALTIFIILILGYTFYKEKKYLHVYILFVILSLIFIPAAGSNTGFLKVKSFSSIVLIFLLFWNTKTNRKTSLQKCFIPTLIFSVMAYSVYNRVSWFYGDYDNIKALKYTVNHEKLSYIKTTSYRKELIEKVIKELYKLNKRDSDIVFFGEAGQMFYYLFETPSLSKQMFYLEPDDKNVIKPLESIIINENRHPVVVIIYGKPNFTYWPQYLNNNKSKRVKKDIKKSEDLIGMLLKNGYKRGFSDSAFIILN